MEPLVIDDALHLVGVGAYLPKSKTLVVSDLQLGQEGQLRAQGHDVRYQDAERMIGLLRAMLHATGATRVVIDGDLKHAFGQILPQERRDVYEIVRALRERAEVVLVRGNHDTLTGPLARELDLALVDSWTDGTAFVLHGHATPARDDPAYAAASNVIIGHLHPAVTLSDGIRAERVKCALVGRTAGKRLVVLPSCTTLAIGADILRVEPRGPFLDPATLDAMTVYLTDETGVRAAGTVRQVRAAVERLSR